MQQILIYIVLVHWEHIIFGQTIEFVNKCKELGIKTQIEDKLKEQIFPKLYISELEQVPNENYVYRSYQERLLQSLACAGRRSYSITYQKW